MATDARHDAPRATRPPLLWFSLVVPVAIWAVHLTMSYTLIALNCYWDWFSFTVLGFDGLRFTLVAITLVGAAVIAIGGVLSYRRWQDLRRADDPRRVDPSGVYRFLSIAGVFVSIFFVLGLVWTIGPTMLVDQC